eukprot:11837-Heterococcus_DN1.PRE.1
MHVVISVLQITEGYWPAKYVLVQWSYKLSRCVSYMCQQHSSLEVSAAGQLLMHYAPYSKTTKRALVVLITLAYTVQQQQSSISKACSNHPSTQHCAALAYHD